MANTQNSRQRRSTSKVEETISETTVSTPESLDSDTLVATDTKPTAISKSGALGWFTVNAEGCSVRFGIEPQMYMLKLDTPNYNAIFSTLLACWLNCAQLTLTYSTLRATPIPDEDAPREIISIAAFAPGH